MKKRIMFLGASRYYLRSIQAAQAMGCWVLAVDRNPHAEGAHCADAFEAVDIADTPLCIATARQYGIDGVLPLNDFGVPTAAAIAAALSLPGISEEAAAIATSKLKMREVFERHQVPSARFRAVSILEEAEQAVKDLATWPLILKPADSRGGGSRGVSRLDSPEQLAEALAFAQSFYADQTVLIEEYLVGSEHSLETLTYAGETRVLAIADKVKTPPPFRVDKSVIYPTALTPEQVREVVHVARQAVRAIGITAGAAHIELCYTADGPRLFELGARCGGGGTPDPIIPHVTGISLIEAAVRIALGESPGDLTPSREWGCVYHFLTPPPGRLSEVSGLEEVRGWPGILDCEVVIKPGTAISQVRTGGDRAGFIIAGAPDRERAMQLASAAEDRIRFQMAEA